MATTRGGGGSASRVGDGDVDLGEGWNWGAMGGATLMPGYSQEYPTFFFKNHLYIKYTYMHILC